MTPARWEILLRCRERALNDRQLLMVRAPEFHGTMIATALLQQAALQQRSRVVIPQRKARRRRR